MKHPSHSVPHMIFYFKIFITVFSGSIKTDAYITHYYGMISGCLSCRIGLTPLNDNIPDLKGEVNNNLIRVYSSAIDYHSTTHFYYPIYDF